MSNPHDGIYRASNNKWGYTCILKVLNQQCVTVAQRLNEHANRIENEAIEVIKAAKEGRTYKPRPSSSHDIEQPLALLLVSVEQVLVLLQDTYPNSAKNTADYLKHWRYITELNSGDETPVKTGSSCNCAGRETHQYGCPMA